jgi:hypothetical protein
MARPPLLGPGGQSGTRRKHRLVCLYLGHGDQSLFPTEEAGGIFPAPSTEKSAPYDSKRAGLAPGPWKHLALMTLLFSKN